ncbi:hypothetical protein [Peribacillus asahii]|uniref:hypothetical protein n=1 Tax=Peribacillus asahii TaxID=228899 RepID=UPI0038265F6D
MKFADHLSKKDIQKFNQLRREQKDKPKPKRKKKDGLSSRDIAELMGTNSRGLRRKKGGAWSNG